MTSGMDCAETWSAQVGEKSLKVHLKKKKKKAQMKVLRGHMVDK